MLVVVWQTWEPLYVETLSFSPFHLLSYFHGCAMVETFSLWKEDLPFSLLFLDSGPKIWVYRGYLGLWRLFDPISYGDGFMRFSTSDGGGVLQTQRWRK